MRILIIEDDKQLATTLEEALSIRYTADVALNGAEGERAARSQAYDVLIIDIALPDTDGVTICHQLRSAGISSPILILTAVTDVDRKVAAFEAGADDYLTKPFEMVELLARVSVLLRRRDTSTTVAPLQVADLQLDRAAHTVRRGDTVIELRPKEFNLLEFLMKHKGRVVSHADIREHVWGSEQATHTNTVAVHMKHLRDKVDRPFDIRLIKTISGLGYKIDDV